MKKHYTRVVKKLEQCYKETLLQCCQEAQSNKFLPIVQTHLCTLVCFFCRVFYMIYVLEMVLKMIAIGFIGYFRSHWNKLDFTIIIFATGGKKLFIYIISPLWQGFMTPCYELRRNKRALTSIRLFHHLFELLNTFIISYYLELLLLNCRHYFSQKKILLKGIYRFIYLYIQIIKPFKIYR